MQLDSIHRAIAAGLVRVTDHADEEMAADHLTLDEVLSTVQTGEIIEDYPSDRPLPSCLVYGQDGTSRPVHSVWAYNNETGRTVLITVYRPDPDRWTDWRTRKKP